jgi:hypothetical protein
MTQGVTESHEDESLVDRTQSPRLLRPDPVLGYFEAHFMKNEVLPTVLPFICFHGQT